MLLLDNLLLAPGKAVMTIFEELARKAQEEFLDDGPVKKELQEIYALLEAGNLSETDFASREQLLLQRLEQIARAKLPPAALAALAEAFSPAADPQVLVPEVLPPAPDFRALVPALVPDVIPAAPDFRGLEVPRVELPTLELPPVAFPRVEFPPIALPHIEVPSIAAKPVELPRFDFAPAAVAAVVMTAPAAATPLPPIAAQPAPEPPPVRLTPPQVVERALRGLVMLKMKVSAVIAVSREAKGWLVVAELVESRAVPDTSDLLGIYEVQLDESGEILGYVRTRMRRRCDLGGGR